MSLSAELEQLEKKRAELKSEWESIQHREQRLTDSVVILEEKLAVQELEEKVKGRRAALEQLENKKKNLEKKLKAPQEHTEPASTPQKPAEPSEIIEKKEEPRKEEPMEVTVSATPTDKPQPKQFAAPVQSQHPKKPEERKEKKKRRWF
ncbi:MAG: hypothetical protein NWE77_07940 [Candidatus Bathyarchaeota archaeon]|nr:hypothetical protein [Candidatus Bathyarchaeota archaeon]